MASLLLFTLLRKQLTSEEAAKEVCGNAVVSEAKKFCGLSWRCWGRLGPAQEKGHSVAEREHHAASPALSALSH